MEKYALGLNSILLLTPPKESAQTKCRQCCLRPLDEVFALGLGNAVMMAPVGASHRHHHGVAKIDTAIITKQGGGG
jgi:hypothetical protein